MGYDPYSPICLAVINVLCLPAAPIRGKIFESYVSWLQAHASCIASAVSDSAELSGTSTHPTSLFFNYGTDLGPNVLRNASFYEPSRQIQVAFGLVDGSKLVEDTGSPSLFLQQAYEGLHLFLKRNGKAFAVPHILVLGASTDVADENVTFLESIDDTNVLDHLSRSLGRIASSALSLLSKDIESATDIPLPSSVIPVDRLNGADSRSERHTSLSRLQTPTVNSSSPSTTAQQLGSTHGEASTSASPGKLVASGIISLQQGDWLEALGQLTIAARAARDVNDPAWHAKALEGLLVCMLLLAWAGIPFNLPQDCYPNTKSFPSTSVMHAIADINRAMSDRAISGGASGLQGLNATIPGLIATITNLYERASIGYDDGLPYLISCEAKVRLARLLVTIQTQSGSLSMATLTAIVGHLSPTDHAGTSKTQLGQLVLQPLLLGNLLIESITEAQARLSVQSVIPIYLAACVSLATLKLDRKLGFYLKEVLQKLPQTLVEARKVGAAEMAVHPSSSGVMAVSPNGREYHRTSQGVRSLLEQVSRVYGLPATDIKEGSPPPSLLERLTAWLSVIQSGDISTRLEVLRLCIRVSDALPDWLGSIYFMSLLLFVSRQSMTISVGSFTPGSLIPTEEQTRLLNGIQHTSNAAQKLKTSVLAYYWDDFLVRQIALHETPSAGKLMPHSSQDLSQATVSGTEKRDPFIYNPFSGIQTASGPLILVKGESVTFDVLLQNPLEVDIEVEQISLITSGCAFEAQSHSMVIGPLCVQRFTMKGVAKDVGSLTITGCNAKIKHCRTRDFEIYTAQWQPPKAARQKLRKPSQSQNNDFELPAPSTLELRVIDALPQISVHSTSLTQNSAMLLDGESCKFQVILENLSDTPADLVLFSYQDSVTRQLQEALSAKDLQPADMFELQHQLTGKAAIRRVSPNNSHKGSSTASNIDAQSTRTFEFEIVGKAGLTDVTVLVDYAYLGRPRSEVEGTFYTRQLNFKVNVTVNASVDIPRCNILSLPTIQPKETRRNEGDSLATNTYQQSDQCLLQLDLRSIWPSPISVKIETCPNSADIHNESKWHTAASQTLQPGMIDRTLIPLPKIFIEDPFAPIPSLDTKRQFVVSASAISLEAEMATREAFWYRENLCRNLRITWSEEHGSRTGTLDARKGIRLSARMIDALKVDHVQISFALLPVDDPDADADVPVVQQRPGGAPAEFLLKRSEFARLVIRVQNLTTEELRLLLRLQPSIHRQPHNIAMDLTKKFLWSGALQQVLPGGTLGPKETREAQLGVVALVVGSYEINATVEEVRSSRARRTDSGAAVAATVVNERRIWHARRPCLIHAVDDLGS